MWARGVGVLGLNSPAWFIDLNSRSGKMLHARLRQQLACSPSAQDRSVSDQTVPGRVCQTCSGEKKSVYGDSRASLGNPSPCSTKPQWESGLPGLQPKCSLLLQFKAISPCPVPCGLPPCNHPRGGSLFSTSCVTMLAFP